jgi:RNA polymerase sigma factor (sigma-70 family)
VEVHLLAEFDGLRRLARSLVRDEADADDLLQDAAVIALEHPPQPDRPARPWLAKVIVNRWRMNLRSARRRQAREDAAQPVEDEPTDPLERAQMLRRLGEAIVGLAEPYRAIVIAHYFDAKPCDQIARELGVAAVTVRSRLSRARVQLRAALDDSAPRDRWKLALVPFSVQRSGSATRLLAAVVAIALLALGLVAIVWPASHASDTAVTTRAPSPRRDLDVVGRAAAFAHPDHYRPAERAHAEPAALHGGGAASGRVLDELTGKGIAGAEVTFVGQGGVTVVRTNDMGEFELVAAQPGRYTLESATAPGFVTYAPDLAYPSIRLALRPDREVRDVVLFLVRDVVLRGRVIDETGLPVAGATVTLETASAAERNIEGTWTTSADGSFTYHRTVAGAILEATLGDRRGGARPGREEDLAIVIAPAPPRDATIAGRVVSDAGLPIADVVVRAKLDHDASNLARPFAPDVFATSGSDGTFVLTGLDRGFYTLSTDAADSAPTTLRHIAANTRDIDLALVAGELLDGRVVTDSGEPVPVFTLLVYQRAGSTRELVASHSIVDAGGRFTTRIEPGRHEVAARAPGWAPSAIIAASPGYDLELVVTEGARLSGTIVSSSSGAPISLARVSRDNESRGCTTLDDRAPVTSSDGRFELPNLAPGPIALTVRVADHTTTVETGLIATAGTTLGPVTIAFAPSR